MNKQERYDSLFIYYGGQSGMDWVLLKAQVKQESNFNPDAVSPAGAKGIAQFMPATWEEWGEGDVFEPEKSIEAQAKYMAHLKRYLLKTVGVSKGVYKWTLAAYNWGIGNVKKMIDKHGCDFDKLCAKMPEETQGYVSNIMKYYEEFIEMTIEVKDYYLPASTVLSLSDGGDDEE